MALYQFDYDRTKSLLIGKSFRFARCEPDRPHHAASGGLQVMLALDDSAAFPFPRTVVMARFQTFLEGVCGGTSVSRDLVLPGRPTVRVPALRMPLQFTDAHGAVLAMTKIWIYFADAPLNAVYGQHAKFDGVFGREDFPPGTVTTGNNYFDVSVP